MAAVGLDEDEAFEGGTEGGGDAGEVVRGGVWGVERVFGGGPGEVGEVGGGVEVDVGVDYGGLWGVHGG